jgi:hypothetical protein
VVSVIVGLVIMVIAAQSQGIVEGAGIMAGLAVVESALYKER